MNDVLKKIDTVIYSFIGPFGTLYVFPQAFLTWDRQLNLQWPRHEGVVMAGTILMLFGGALALWCATLMHVRRGALSLFDYPYTLVASGPYRLVRHPMMWSLNIVLIGEVLLYRSPLIALWLVIWCRFAMLYIARYEEPHLLALFGSRYSEYCERTPRWIPLSKAR